MLLNKRTKVLNVLYVFLTEILTIIYNRTQMAIDILMYAKHVHSGAYSICS